jgi:hypothetical protein
MIDASFPLTNNDIDYVPNLVLYMSPLQVLVYTDLRYKS